MTSSPLDSEMLDFDKTPSNETESNLDSDDEELNKKKNRSLDDQMDFDNDDFDETDLRNIWRKRRRISTPTQLSTMTTATTQNDRTYYEQNNPDNNQKKSSNEQKHTDKYSTTNCSYVKRFDHQVPAIVPVHHDDTMLLASGLVKLSFPCYKSLCLIIFSGSANLQDHFRQVSAQKQSFLASPQYIQQLQQLYQANSSPSNDLSSYDFSSAGKYSFPSFH